MTQLHFTHLKGFLIEKNSLAANVTYHPDDANRAICMNAPKTLQLASSFCGEFAMCDRM